MFAEKERDDGAALHLPSPPTLRASNNRTPSREKQQIIYLVRTAAGSSGLLWVAEGGRGTAEA